MKALESVSIRLFVVVACFVLFCQAGAAVAQEDQDDQQEAKTAGGAVYVMNNEASGNVIVKLQRNQDGTLARVGEYSTGGRGSGPGPLPVIFGGPGPGPLPLESQDSLIATKDGRYLLAVNAGSNDISVMAVTRNGLRLTDRGASGGVFPVSIATFDGLVYVVNLGGVPDLSGSPGTPTMTGFLLDERGKLNPIPQSTRDAGAFGSSPADLVFSPEGDFLVVSERVTNLLDVYRVMEDGRLGEKTVTPSNNHDPFGMEFTRKGVLVVTEGVDQSPRIPQFFASTTSSYRLREDGTLQTISAAVPTHQTAACWVRFSKDQKFAYVVNSGSNSISTYSISPRGELTLLIKVAGDTGGPISAAIDEAVTPNGKFLYVDSPLIGSLRGFRIEENGSLTPITKVDGFPVSFSGIVAF
jgi:6-phosphogluconolactonase (cycloisomerase 2 family)